MRFFTPLRSVQNDARAFARRSAEATRKGQTIATSSPTRTSWLISAALTLLGAAGWVGSCYAGRFIELMDVAGIASIAFAVMAFVGGLWFWRLARQLKGAALPLLLCLLVCPVVLFSGFLLLAALSMSCALGPHPIEHLITNGKDKLQQIGKGISQYTQDNNEFYPFDERGPLHSLALLYPKYVDNPKTFESPLLMHSLRWRRQALPFPSDTPLAGKPCGFGYSWRIKPAAVSNFAIAAELPPLIAKTWGNVLYVDGHVSRYGPKNPFFCSNNPLDNIFAPESGWGADTDSYIRQSP